MKSFCYLLINFWSVWCPGSMICWTWTWIKNKLTSDRNTHHLPKGRSANFFLFRGFPSHANFSLIPIGESFVLSKRGNVSPTTNSEFKAITRGWRFDFSHDWLLNEKQSNRGRYKRVLWCGLTFSRVLRAVWYHPFSIRVNLMEKSIWIANDDDVLFLGKQQPSYQQ